MGNVLSKLQNSDEIEIKKLFDSVPAEYKKTRGELGNTDGDPYEVFIGIRGLNWMLNNTSNRNLRQRIMTVKQALIETSV